ncbi:MAG: zinc ABC transporter substrate-binding protein [Thiotrichaceae bacterium]|nr:zinc ABC transporter substrate-binding protein [Thiotrichaceae bacterium]
MRKINLAKLCIVLFFNSLFLLISPLHARADEPIVLSSIQPIYLIVKELLGDIGKAELLIPANTDLHHYQLRPSALRKIVQADLIIHLSPQAEPFLEALLQDKAVLSLAANQRLKWLTSRHDHSQHHDEHDTDKHDADEAGEEFVINDPHLWLNPKNAEEIVLRVAQWLTKNYPQLEAGIKINSQQLVNKIQVIDAQNKDVMRSLKHRRYMVLHDASQYFQVYYGLEEPYILSLQEAIRPGIKSYRQARQKIKENDIACILSSQSNPNTALPVITSDLAVKYVSINFSGMGMTSYTQFFQQFSQKMIDCLTPSL